MGREFLNQTVQILAKDYIFSILDKMEGDYDNNRIDYKFIYDYLFISVLAIKIGYKKSKWEKIGYFVCKQIKYYVENYRIDESNYGMFSGFGYLSFCIKKYSENVGVLKNFSISINKLFINSIRTQMATINMDTHKTRSEDYDCISGIAGELYYLLSLDYDNYDCKDLIEDMVKYLVWLTDTHLYNGKRVKNFHIPCECQFLEHEKIVYPNGNFNMGMAHGIAGILVALSLAYKRGIKVNGIKIAIDSLFDFYEEFQVDRKDSFYWAGQLSYESFLDKVTIESELHYASSWCYGNIGIMLGLIKSAENIDSFGFLNELMIKLEKILQKSSISEFFLVSPALCHGYASVVAAIIKIVNWNKNSRIVDLNEAVIAMIELSKKNTEIANKDNSLIDNENGRLEGYIGNYSLLDGVTGIISVLAEIIWGIDEYRELLLI